MQEIVQTIEEFSKAFPTAEIRRNEPMCRHTSFRIGGPVTALVLPKSEAELVALCAVARQHGVHPLIVGNGTNLLVDDRPLDLLVVKTTGLDAMDVQGTTIDAGCGVLLSRLASEAQRHGLAGLAFAHGIPGSVGGAVSMNAGAYGGEMKDVVRSVRFLSPEGKVCVCSGAENGFGYRHSRYTGTEDIVLGAQFALTLGDAETIRAQMDELAARRREKQPLNLPSAGSTFKRPKEGYAAAMIEQAGLKGKGVGGACVSEKHAGFVVNNGGATFDDVLRTMQMVRQAVYQANGVWLEPEVKIIRQNGEERSIEQL